MSGRIIFLGTRIDFERGSGAPRGSRPFLRSSMYGAAIILDEPIAISRESRRIIFGIGSGCSLGEGKKEKRREGGGRENRVAAPRLFGLFLFIEYTGDCKTGGIYYDRFESRDREGTITLSRDAKIR